MASKFRVYFETKSLDHERIDYELLDSSLTAKWIAVVTDAFSKSLPIGRVLMQGKSTKSYQKKIEADLIESLEKSNLIEKHPMQNITPKDINVLQHQLRSLIDSFHIRGISSQPIGPLLKLEQLCQQMHALISVKDTHFQVDRKISFEFLEASFTPLDDKDSQLLTTNPQFGDLLLGTSRLGKTIGDCYFNDDIDFIKKGMLQQRHSIGAEVTLAFPTKNPPADSFKKLQARVTKWALNHGIEECGIKIDDPFIANFQPAKIGEILTPLNGTDIDLLIKNGARILKAEIL